MHCRGCGRARHGGDAGVRGAHDGICVRGIRGGIASIHAVRASLVRCPNALLVVDAASLRIAGHGVQMGARQDRAHSTRGAPGLAFVAAGWEAAARIGHGTVLRNTRDLLRGGYAAH